MLNEVFVDYILVCEFMNFKGQLICLSFNVFILRMNFEIAKLLTFSGYLILKPYSLGHLILLSYPSDLQGFLTWPLVVVQ